MGDSMEDLVALGMFGVIYTGLTKSQKHRVKTKIRRHKAMKHRSSV